MEIWQNLPWSTARRRAAVRGCTPPVLRRQFFADMRLGGRFYAVGPEAYQNVKTKDRHILRLDGSPVVEVDLRASALSILLALTGRPIPEDPYAVGPLAACEREAVKAWFVQTLNSGRPAVRWSDRHAPSVQRVPIRAIAATALAAYPEVASAPSLLPADLAQRVPMDRHGWALGQWLVGIEAEVMQAALERLAGRGVVALPIHDALLCREEDAQEACKSLVEAFQHRLGAEPRVRIKTASSESLELPAGTSQEVA